MRRYHYELLYQTEGTGLGIADTFNRANANLSASPTTSSGHTWESPSGGGAISSNRLVAAGSTSPIVHVIETGRVDVTAVSAPGTGEHATSLVFRYSDLNNYWFYGITTATSTAQLLKMVAGSSSSVYTAANNSAPVNASLKVVTSGNSISIYVNNTLLTAVADSFNQTATKHGLRWSLATHPQTCNTFTLD